MAFPIVLVSSIFSDTPIKFLTSIQALASSWVSVLFPLSPSDTWEEEVDSPDVDPEDDSELVESVDPLDDDDEPSVPPELEEPVLPLSTESSRDPSSWTLLEMTEPTMAAAILT